MDINKTAPSYLINGQLQHIQTQGNTWRKYDTNVPDVPITEVKQSAGGCGCSSNTGKLLIGGRKSTKKTTKKKSTKKTTKKKSTKKTTKKKSTKKKSTKKRSIRK
jgi:hypothetical protein